MNNEQQCKCELDGFQGAVWKGDCPLHKDDDKFIPHTNNNWIEEFRDYFDKTLKPKKPTIQNLDRELCIDFISNLLTKKDQEHKAELEIISNTIKNTEIKIEGSVLPEELKTVMEYEMRKALDKFSLAILDSHINKLSTE